jgi:hypothetical protein
VTEWARGVAPQTLQTDDRITAERSQPPSEAEPSADKSGLRRNRDVRIEAVGLCDTTVILGLSFSCTKLSFQREGGDRGQIIGTMTEWSLCHYLT